MKSWRIVLSTMTVAVLLVGCGKKGTDTIPPANSGQGGGDTLQGSHGVVQNVRQAAKRVADGGELKNFATAYLQHALGNGGRGPAKLQDIRDSLNPKSVDGFKDDEVYVANWNLPNVTGTSIIAYAKTPDSYGTRLVAKGDGSVGRMTKEEFEKAQKQ